jgi:O-antigen chain-terminating methyltransferase
MFVSNNDRLPFEDLEDRVGAEIRRQSRSAQPNEAKQSAPAQPQVTRGTLSKWTRIFLSWGWTILHARRVRESANEAKIGIERLTGRIEGGIEQRLISAETQLSSMAMQISAVEAQLRETDSRRLIELEAVRKELASAISDQAALKREMMFQQRRLSKRLQQEVPLVQSSSQGDDAERLDSFYVAFEDVFRGSFEDIKRRIAPYVEVLRLAGATDPSKPVLDIGCGRGEWLELLREQRIGAYGIDVNSMMIERAMARGLDARRADLLAHLTSLPDAHCGAITAFHVVEHLPLTVLVDFLDEALRVLTPGGVLILETPNPETVRVGATTFYNDPTHRNPLPPLVLQFLVQHRGFEQVEIRRLHPFEEGLLQDKTVDAALLNQLLFGPQDYAIIARRG